MAARVRLLVADGADRTASDAVGAVAPLADTRSRISRLRNWRNSVKSPLSRQAHSMRQSSGILSFTTGRRRLEKLSVDRGERGQK